MNKRIKELREQALTMVSDEQQAHGESYEIRELWDRHDQKFAELIVRECLDIASEIRGEPRTDTHFVIGYDLACKRMVEAFKEHFGIES